MRSTEKSDYVLVNSLRAVHGRLYPYRRAFAVLTYAAVIAVSYAAAYLVRFEFEWPANYTGTFALTLPVLIGVRMAAVGALRITRERWRYVSTPDIVRLSIAMIAGSAAFAVVVYLLSLEPAVPRSVLLLEWIFTTHVLAGLRLAYRLAYETLRHARSRNGEAPRRTLVVGAGEAGQMLVHEMQRYPTGYGPVGFVDDDPVKWGSRIHGIEVIGAAADLQGIADETGAEEIVLAVPSAEPEELRRLVAFSEDTELPFKILPGIAEVLAGRASPDLLRDVRVEDLLGREPVELELPELAEDLGGRVILVTGAAGSIGSELVRQVALHGPERLLLLDRAETPLFYLDLEVREHFPDLDVVPVIADVTDPAAIESVFKQYRPDRVFHAAAYKHVPLMETNGRQAVRNNVVGTWRVAETAGRHGVGRFILISTDKAVRPSSVMGATKRLAEGVVLELQDRYPETAFGAVRFGNVLGSAGSVIPIFKQQLAAGKPLTVTHPDVTRYFMTIPEAAQLVLQASLLPELRGHVAMLEMGDPIAIVELAQNLLRLSGRGNGHGPGIRFTGLRPGEKLHEELVGPEEETLETRVNKVRIVRAGGTDWDGITAWLARYDETLDDHGGEVILRHMADRFPELQVKVRRNEEADVERVSNR